MHPDDRYTLAAIGHGHGGHHGGFHGHGGIAFSPWWPMYESDVDGLYGEERDDRLAEKIAQRLATKSPTVAVGQDDGMDGLDMLGADTLTGLDWLNVFKNTTEKLTGSGDDKARAETKAKQEKTLAAEKSSKWKWAAGAALLGSVVGFFLGRK